ncbi:extracellular solute-binding protein [Acholeplasma hippikon]|uniref:Spermidine/putrescine-binding periplasmic protein n=1 Tax=Acholeplasma hippikon TaxID=264636 RepID=A0A449BI93_9MOLU|nr:extracellular solute-binding protein [Acholeplasma hippikon]VEU82174.1 Spermidine/putrescine-binding periplasmic protein precursor [Acholeplasma hippikon]
MKKILVAMLLVLSTLVLTACGGNKLVIYLPNEYIADGIVEAFEKETGIKVDIRTFDSNEIALTQARINKYDLIIPSDYAIEEFAAEGLIQELDWSKIEFDQALFSTSLKNILEQMDEEGFDFLKYSMPYYWGTFGFLYKNEKFTKEEVETAGWSMFQNQSITKMIYDSPRDAFMTALYSLNPVVKMADATEQDVVRAKDWLIAAKGANTVLKSDEILDEASGGSMPYDIAMVYSGDAVYLLQETEGYSFAIPENTNVFIDGFVIPSNARNVDWAYEFINFMSTYDVMLENTSWIGYSPVRQDVLEALLADEEFTYDERIEYAFDIDVTAFNYEFYRFNNDLKKWIDDNYDLFTFAK